jgi:hypothetical protein
LGCGKVLDWLKLEGTICKEQGARRRGQEQGARRREQGGGSRERGVGRRDEVGCARALSFAEDEKFAGGNEPGGNEPRTRKNGKARGGHERAPLLAGLLLA